MVQWIYNKKKAPMTFAKGAYYLQHPIQRLKTKTSTRKEKFMQIYN